ncbi:MAG: hypothetical protein KA201_28265, partial [Kofleriaceae bacterium]|nr:hypothetical protein [Kofleriaceae bacterium]
MVRFVSMRGEAAVGVPDGVMPVGVYVWKRPAAPPPPPGPPAALPAKPTPGVVVPNEPAPPPPEPAPALGAPIAPVVAERL